MTSQDDSLVAFRDINPAAKEHILIISKAHIPSLFDLQATEADIQMGKAMWLTWSLAELLSPHEIKSCRVACSGADGCNWRQAAEQRRALAAQVWVPLPPLQQRESPPPALLEPTAQLAGLQVCGDARALGWLHDSGAAAEEAPWAAGWSGQSPCRSLMTAAMLNEVLQCTNRRVMNTLGQGVIQAPMMHMPQHPALVMAIVGNPANPGVHSTTRMVRLLVC